ncbi:MAG TPA: hypothetical protein VHE55_09685 [Fimbriimonadaceae bacterium]|nr:hypothetical protein [Fimbriimonadaceae bacterium]
MIQNCRLTHCEEVNACRFGKDLIIYGQGDALSGCDGVRVQYSPLDVFPPQFVVMSCRQSPIGAFCSQLVVPTQFIGIFKYPTDQTSVKVGTRDGLRDVPISACRIATPAHAADVEGVLEAIGYSADSYDDAIRNAYANLDLKSDVADALFTATIVESGYMSGGIVGFDHFFVKVRGRVD